MQPQNLFALISIKWTPVFLEVGGSFSCRGGICIPRSRDKAYKILRSSLKLNGKELTDFCREFGERRTYLFRNCLHLSQHACCFNHLNTKGSTALLLQNKGGLHQDVFMTGRLSSCLHELVTPPPQGLRPQLDTTVTPKCRRALASTVSKW